MEPFPSAGTLGFLYQLTWIALVLFAAFAFLREQGKIVNPQDRGTKAWITLLVVAAIFAALQASRYLTIFRISTGQTAPAIALLFLWGGAGLLLWAILTLGKFFRTKVMIAQDQRVIQAGPYRFIRHPAYAAQLLMFLGFGLALNNWLSVLALVLLPLPAYARRVAVEEEVLTRSLPGYGEYMRKTKRLLPGIW